MGPSSFDAVSPPEPVSTLPACVLQSSHRLQTLVSLVILALCGMALAVPYAAVLLHLIDEPSAREAAAGQPGRVLHAGLGLVVGMIIIGWPAGRLARRLVRRRIVTFTRDVVLVEETGLARTVAWTEPLARYEGIAHHVRASLSGIRHEIILVHPDCERSVLFALASRFAQSDVDRACALFGLPEIPAGRLYHPATPTAPGAFSELHSLRP